MTTEQYISLKQFVPLLKTKTVSTAWVAAACGFTPQHVRRLVAQLEPPRSRQAWNRITDEIRQFVIGEKTENPHRNCQWIAEVTSDRFAARVSRPSVYRILKDAGLLKPEQGERIVRSRFEAKQTADVIQMDTTWGYWWGKDRKEKLCLILLLDDYSRFIVAAQFVDSDTAEANMEMIRSVVEQYGSFRLLYTDNASFFKPIRHNKSQYQKHEKEEYESEITRACREVGITHITHQPYQPQGKGKIERLFRFIQERFVAEIKETDTLEAINEKFQVWVTWYNESHVNRTTGVVPKERFDPNEFTPLNGKDDLADIFCRKDTRKVDKCNQFSYQGVLYQIPKEMCMVAYTVTLHIQPSRSIRVWHKDQFITELPIA